MKFKIQSTNLDITIQNTEIGISRALFSFVMNPLPHAKICIKSSSFGLLDDLSELGSIAVTNNDKSNIIISLGEKNKFNLANYHKSLCLLAKYITKNKKITTIDMILEEQIATLLKIDESSYIEQTIFHLINSMYYFDKFKIQSKKLSLTKINFISNCHSAKVSLSNAIALLNGVYLVKDLGNAPANLVTPNYLAKTAQDIAKLSKKASVKILGRKEIKALKMNSFLAVSFGSEEEPKLITLNYTGAGKEKPIVLVGKGVTFDSGGISIKPSQNMNEMKYDMMGAATILGIFRTVIELNLPINLVVVAPCTENLLSGSALKPSDIVTTMSGQTVEVLNTDAEGRLILCDALTYVERLNPKIVIDIATLTGACITALGYIASALYSNDSKLCQKLKESATRTNDKVWEMPLYDEYEESLKNSIADMSNIGGFGGAGGSVVAAKFLSKFVNYKWAHLDIAGTAWIHGGYDGSNSSGGATGRPFLLLADFIRNMNL